MLFSALDICASRTRDLPRICVCSYQTTTTARTDETATHDNALTLDLAARCACERVRAPRRILPRASSRANRILVLQVASLDRARRARAAGETNGDSVIQVRCTVPRTGSETAAALQARPARARARTHLTHHEATRSVRSACTEE